MSRVCHRQLNAKARDTIWSRRIPTAYQSPRVALQHTPEHISNQRFRYFEAQAGFLSK